MQQEWTLGLYSNARQILDNPGYLPALRDRIGLNLVIIGYCGQLTDETLALTPFNTTPPSDVCMRRLVCTHLDGLPITTEFASVRQSLGPAVGVRRDEPAMLAAIDAAHAAGLKVWLLSEAWTTSDWDNVTYCPSEEAVSRWYEALYVDIATHYPVEGLDITHARYPMTSHLRGMFVCACPRCARAAAELGYDMEGMLADLRDARQSLAHLDVGRLRIAAEHKLGLQDYVQLLDLGGGVLDWFRFRADLLASRFARFREAVHAAAGPEFIFGADTYPASLALYAGHNLQRWGEFSDFASPLISHVDIFQLHTLQVWTRALQALAPELEEPDALRIIYRLVGYDGLGMPERLEAFLLGDMDTVPGYAKTHDCEFRHVPLRALLKRDMAKARLSLPAELPSYPIIQGGGAPHAWPAEIVRGVMDDARALGHQGVMLQGTAALADFPLRG